MNILKSLGIKTHREKIVQRLLADNHITASEAVELLKVKEIVNVRIDNLSSGAKMTIGEDNSVITK